MTSPDESQNQIDAEAADEQVTVVPLLTRAFASGLFTGYSPIASGTFGALVGLAVYFIPEFENPWIALPACVVTFLLGLKTSAVMEEAYGNDPAEVTIDEIVGMWVSLLFLPKSLLTAGFAFFIFRILDILKPFPARKLDRMKGGMGIMGDDVVCGVYTNIILQILVALQIL